MVAPGSTTVLDNLWHAIFLDDEVGGAKSRQRPGSGHILHADVYADDLHTGSKGGLAEATTAPYRVVAHGNGDCGADQRDAGATSARRNGWHHSAL